MKTSRQQKRRSAPGDVAPPVQQYSDRECMLWLLKFLRCDLAALRPHELLALRNEVFPYLHGESRATLTVFDEDELLALGPGSPRRPGVESRHVIAAARELMGGVQHDLWAGVNALQAGMWQPFGLQGPAPPWSFERGDDEAIVRIYLGNWRTITVASAADVLVRWWPELRRCKHEPCGVWFLPTHGRQWYHDARCASTARYQRFKPTRDYKAEYVRRHDSTRPTARHHPSGRRTRR